MFLEHDYTDLGPVSIAELADMEVPKGHELVYVETPGQQPNIPYDYEITHFPTLDERQPGINIKTPNREVFLMHGSEADAQTALVRLATNVHRLTGGVVDIHPFFGAIYNNILDPVAEEWTKGPGDIVLDDDWLSIRLALVANGGLFSDTLSEHAAGIPLTFALPSPEADRWLANQRLANRANPNQSAKDQATANDLAERWQAEFDSFNTPELIEQEPMAVTLGSIALLMNALDDSGAFTATAATVRVRQPA